MKEREKGREKAENKKRPDVDKFHVTVLGRSFVCVKISYLGSLSHSLSSINKNTISLTKNKNSILFFYVFVVEESGPVDRNLLSFFS